MMTDIEIAQAAQMLPITEVAGKIGIDQDELVEIIQSIRENMPTEIIQAKRVAQNSTDIIRKAERNAEEIIEKARQRADVMVEEHQITKEAKEAALAIMQQAKEESQALINASKLKANEIADKAERWSNDMRRNASAYVENVIKDTDETLTRSVNDIRTLRQSLHDALNAPSEPRPDFD